MTGREQDWTRLATAAHELGHATGFREAGMPIRSIEVSGPGSGVVHLSSETPAPGRELPFLVGILAGQCAWERYLHVHSLDSSGPRRAGCQTDLAVYRRLRRRCTAAGPTRRCGPAPAAWSGPTGARSPA